MAKKSTNITTITAIVSFATACIFFLLMAMFFVTLLIDSAPGFGNVAVVPIEGVIVVNGEAGFAADVAKSAEVIEQLTQANEDESIKAILLEINSPGGSPVASAEIADYVKTIEKPTYAVITSTGASGAYWIASAADRVYTHRYAVTGSIGVIGSYLEFDGFLRDHNITYRRLVAGKHKDAGTPFKEMTGEEEALFQKLLDDLHNAFIDEVAQNRNLPREQVVDLATGWVYLGNEAVELGLADKTGNLDTATQDLETELNMTADLIVYEREETFLDALGSVSYQLGKGLGTSLQPNALTIRT